MWMVTAVASTFRAMPCMSPRRTLQVTMPPCSVGSTVRRRSVPRTREVRKGPEGRERTWNTVTVRWEAGWRSKMRSSRDRSMRSPRVQGDTVVSTSSALGEWYCAGRGVVGCGRDWKRALRSKPPPLRRGVGRSWDEASRLFSAPRCARRRQTREWVTSAKEPGSRLGSARSSSPRMERGDMPNMAWNSLRSSVASSGGSGPCCMFRMLL
mmetsp:Transcript_31498/g.72130  ORF Transcript_31498/g.72130 Transcript_31498/m.72130 type:complete len:210 (-) Transcript_31498:218-847(-)